MFLDALKDIVESEGGLSDHFSSSKALLVWPLSSGKDWRVRLRLGLEWVCF